MGTPEDWNIIWFLFLQDANETCELKFLLLHLSLCTKVSLYSPYRILRSLNIFLKFLIRPFVLLDGLLDDALFFVVLMVIVGMYNNQAWDVKTDHRCPLLMNPEQRKTIDSSWFYVCIYVPAINFERLSSWTPDNVSVGIFNIKGCTWVYKRSIYIAEFDMVLSFLAWRPILRFSGYSMLILQTRFLVRSWIWQWRNNIAKDLCSKVKPSP